MKFNFVQYWSYVDELEAAQLGDLWWQIHTTIPRISGSTGNPDLAMLEITKLVEAYRKYGSHVITLYNL